MSSQAESSRIIPRPDRRRLVVATIVGALILVVAGLGRTDTGDVVAVAPYSWVATANVIEHSGATPPGTQAIHTASVPSSLHPSWERWWWWSGKRQ